MKQGFANMLENLGEKTLGKVFSKVPEWSGIQGIEVPGTLCAEQCSSSKTAECKARLASRLAPGGKRLADLTGGLGVDSWFFSRVFPEVLYFERNTALCEAATRNFGRLGASGIHTVNAEFGRDGAGLPELRDFAPDLIYLDPARRDVAGKKVFLLEDCEPDLLQLLPGLLAICPRILVKVSPMADISMLRARIGENLRETRIVQSEGEVKELLLSISKEGGPCGTVLENLDTGGVRNFPPSEEKESAYAFAEGLPAEGELLYEPGPGLMKAGAFKSVCRIFGAKALGPDSHLYILPEGSAPEAALFGKIWKVVESAEMGGRTLREIGKKYPEADVTARGIQMKSEELAKRLGSKPGRGIHIFGIGRGPSRREKAAITVATRL